MKNKARALAGALTQYYCRVGMVLCALLFSSWSVNSMAAEMVSCPTEVKSGEEFPMTDSHKITWHDSNSINFKIDYKVVCSWKNVTASKGKEGHVCTYSEFSECSVEGTPAGTRFYVTDYKPVIKSTAKHKHKT